MASTPADSYSRRFPPHVLRSFRYRTPRDTLRSSAPGQPQRRVITLNRITYLRGQRRQPPSSGWWRQERERRLRLLEKTPAGGFVNGASARGHVELGQDAADVVHHRAVADEE